MGIGSIVANGISAYLGTSQALDQREHEKQRLQEEQAKFNAWQEDRSQQQADKEAKRSLYDGLQQLPGAIAQGAGATPAQPAVEGAPDSMPMGTQKPVLELSALQATNDKLHAFQVEASRLGDQGALNLINQQRKALLGQWAGSFQGDPTTAQGAIDYAQHIAQGAVALGNPLTPEEAGRIAHARQAFENEGAMKALQLAQAGDKDGALKLYNATGSHRFADLELVPATSSAGVKSFNMVGIDADGTRVPLGNAFDHMMGMMTAEAQLKAFHDQQRVVNDTAKARASVAADTAMANLRNAEAKQVREGSGKGGLTLAQQRTNEQIDAARTQTAGLSPEEIKQRTSSYTATGRENAAYDPQLASLIKLARSRKYGPDPEFDKSAQAEQATNPSAQSATDEARSEVAKRFRADPSMNNYTLGPKDEHGYQVLQRGKLIGYWQ